METRDVRLANVSPRAWRLLRVAADYEQRTVERELDDILQAHVSMLESGNRALSDDRLRQLFDLYAAELDAEQVSVLLEHF
ncbi:hypothetical protein [Halospeciosus flavus]|uniref:Helix-turn-helix domain-containing protein n=1 Tax=Halospeciosus flavus TaxID=3032283 RepID=A0ABD5Z916_9EURY|nr:hypothetical protein [Halospeciosus flavus]